MTHKGKKLKLHRSWSKPAARRFTTSFTFSNNFVRCNVACGWNVPVPHSVLCPGNANLEYIVSLGSVPHNAYFMGTPLSEHCIDLLRLRLNG